MPCSSGLEGASFFWTLHLSPSRSLTLTRPDFIFHRLACPRDKRQSRRPTRIGQSVIRSCASRDEATGQSECVQASRRHEVGVLLQQDTVTSPSVVIAPTKPECSWLFLPHAVTEMVSTNGSQPDARNILLSHNVQPASCPSFRWLRASVPGRSLALLIVAAATGMAGMAGMAAWMSA